MNLAVLTRPFLEWKKQIEGFCSLADQMLEEHITSDAELTSFTASIDTWKTAVSLLLQNSFSDLSYLNNFKTTGRGIFIPRGRQQMPRVLQQEIQQGKSEIKEKRDALRKYIRM